MKPIFIGVVAASLFGIVATKFLGTEGLLTNAWVDVVLWSLIGVGAALSAVDTAWGCLPCHVSRLVHKQSLIDRLCHNAPCAH